MLRGEIIYIDFSEEEMNNTLRWFADTVDEIRDTIVFEAHSGNFYCNNFCLLGRCELCDE